jgi:hypothetical protein
MDTMLLCSTRAPVARPQVPSAAQFASRRHKGDPGAPAPFTVVAGGRAEGRDALPRRARVLRDGLRRARRSILAKVGKEQNFDWGNNLFAYGRQDYPFVTRVLNIQTVTMNGPARSRAAVARARAGRRGRSARSACRTCSPT